MNSIQSNRVFNPLLSLACVATIIIISALSIQLLYGVYRFIQIFIQETYSQSSQYFSQLIKAIN